MEEDTNLVQNKTSKAEIQQGCCNNFLIRCISLTWIPQCCKNCLSSPKDRILARAFKTGLKEEMSISHLIRHVRVTEGILKERLGYNEPQWKEAYTKYSSVPISRVNNSVINGLSKIISNSLSARVENEKSATDQVHVGPDIT